MPEVLGCMMEMSEMERKFDLGERLLKFAARIVRLSGALPKTVAGRHVGEQVLRSGAAPMAHHGEAQAAESRKDFVHKMRIRHNELRETIRWLRLIKEVPMVDKPENLGELIAECDELIRIFLTSIRTAKEEL